jgi:predicted transcriptional regulator
MASRKDVNSEKVGMNGYYSEGEAASNSFRMTGGSFTVNDRPHPNTSNGPYTAKKLNESRPEYDHADLDEPFIPKLDADRVSLPEQITHPSRPQMYNTPDNSGMQGYPNQYRREMQNPVNSTYPQQPANGMQNRQMYTQKTVTGYDQNGMPMYGQPNMYQQPQFLGYDQNGKPLYGMPAMSQQPQLLGYDRNGQPLYGMPAMYQQPQIIGYDRNGMPVYAQQASQPQDPPAAQNPASAQQQSTVMQGTAAVQPQPEPQPREDKRVDVPDDFWEFFDGGKATHHKNGSENDFFGKQYNGDMDDVFSAKSSDMGRMKRFEHKRNDYMGDLPVVDGSKLRPNDAEKFNKLYMRKTDFADANKLEFNQTQKTQDKMRVTGEVSADSLVRNQESLKWNIMSGAGEADASNLQAYVPTKKQDMMAQASQAVEAMPSRKKTYNDLIDEIELPDYIKARKTVKTQTIEIPAIPELQDMYKKG